MNSSAPALTTTSSDLIETKTAERIFFNLSFLTTRRVVLIGSLLVFAGLAFLGARLAQAATGNFTQVGCIGNTCDGNAPVDSISKIARDVQGNYWVLDRYGNQAIKYDATGSRLAHIGSDAIGSYGSESGSIEGQLSNPEGLTLDASGNVYIFDAGNSRVQKFNSAGEFVSGFGSYGDELGQFGTGSHGGDIALDNSGNIFVLDADNSRIQKFNASGSPLTQFATPGSGAGELTNPQLLDTDSYGAVLVTDRYQEESYSEETGTTWEERIKIKRYDNSGAYQSEFGTYGTEPGQFSSINDMSLSKQGTERYYLDGSRGKISKFSGDGFQAEYSYTDLLGEQAYVSAIFVDGTNIVAAYSRDDGSTHVATIDANGQLVGTVELTSSKIEHSGGIAIGPDGKFYVAYWNYNVVRSYGTDMVEDDVFGTLGSYGSDPGVFNEPTDVTLDSQGNLYVADEGNNRIQKFDSNGNLVFIYGDAYDSYGSYGSYAGNVSSPRKITVGTDGTLYTLYLKSPGDTQAIASLDQAGETLTDFNLGNIPGDDDSVIFDIAAAPNGDIYATDLYQGKIHVFSASGSYLRSFGGIGAGEGQFNYPTSIDIDEQNNVYVADGMNSRIQKLSLDGTYVSEYNGLEESEAAPLHAPMHIDASNGKVIINDYISPQGSLSQIIILTDDDFGSSETSTTTTSATTTTVPDSTSTSTTTSVDNSDSDGDGVLDSTEDAGPNGGDGNADGTADSLQTHVSTVLNPTTTKYITLVASSDVVLNSVQASSDSDVTQSDNTYSYPGGFLSFNATVDVGTTNEFKVLVHGVTGNAQDFKLRKIHVDGDDISFETIDEAVIGSQIVGGQQVLSATYNVTDGGDLDQDGLANGVIVDPVGLGTQVVDATTTTTKSGTAPSTSTGGLSGSLPFTGSNSTLLLSFGTLIICLGITIARGARRRHA